MIGTDADAATQLLALEHQGREDLLNVSFLLLKLLGVVVVDHLKGLSAISEVSGVDADLLKALGNHHGNGWLEMDVSHEGHVIPAEAQRVVISSFVP